LLTFWACTVALFGQSPAAEETWRLPFVDDPAVATVAAESPYFAPLGLSPAIANATDEAGFDGGPLFVPPNRFTSTWLAPGGSQGFGNFDLDYNRTWYLGTGVERPPVAITPGFGMHFWSGPQALDLPARVYDLYLDISWRTIDHENGGFALGVTPGIYGDFARLDGDAFQLTGWGLANYHFDPHWNIVGGVAVVRQLNSKVLPIGGVIWTPNEETRLELMIPRPRIARRVWQQESGELWCYLAGQFGGGAWSVADTPTQNVLVSYSDLRLVLGVETINTPGYDLSLELGYVFARDISVNRTTVFSPDPTFLLQATIAF
jgi:hypothetical protein